MEGDDRLAGAGRTGHAGGAAVIALDRLALRRMQEDGPFLPRVVQGTRQFVAIVDEAEAALRIRMGKGIGALGCGRSGRRGDAGRQVQQRLGGLLGQVVRQVEQRSVGGGAHVRQPFGRHTVAEQRGVGDTGEQWRARWGRLLHLDIAGDDDLLDALTHLHQLGSAGRGMDLQLAPLGPFVGLVVMIDIAEQHAARRLVDDQADIAADAHGPEVLVLGAVELVKAHAGAGRIELKVEGGGLDRLLLVAAEAGEAVGKGISDTEVHNTGSYLYIAASSCSVVMLENS